MLEILNRVLDVQIARAAKHGFIPFTFEADVEGKKAKENAQSDRLGRSAAQLSLLAGDHALGLTAKLRELGSLILGEDELARVLRGGDATARESDAASRPSAKVAKLGAEDSSVKHAREIIRRVQWFSAYKDPAYLHAAEQQASIARELFCDGISPLPKAYPEPPRKTESGESFPDFYFRGAKLMHAFALLGEALGQELSKTMR